MERQKETGREDKQKKRSLVVLDPEQIPEGSLSLVSIETLPLIL